MTVRYIWKTLQKRLGLPARNAPKKTSSHSEDKYEKASFYQEIPQLVLATVDESHVFG
jgi:hypothetical protein